MNNFLLFLISSDLAESFSLHFLSVSLTDILLIRHQCKWLRRVMNNISCRMFTFVFKYLSCGSQRPRVLYNADYFLDFNCTNIKKNLIERPGKKERKKERKKKIDIHENNKSKK